MLLWLVGIKGLEVTLSLWDQETSERLKQRRKSCSRLAWGKPGGCLLGIKIANCVGAFETRPWSFRVSVGYSGRIPVHPDPFCRSKEVLGWSFRGKLTGLRRSAHEVCSPANNTGHSCRGYITRFSQNQWNKEQTRQHEEFSDGVGVEMQLWCTL